MERVRDEVLVAAERVLDRAARRILAERIAASERTSADIQDVKREEVSRSAVK